MEQLPMAEYGGANSGDMLPGGLVDDLIILLQKGQCQVDKLLELGEKKRQALLDDDIVALEEIIVLEIPCLEEYESTEAKRLQLMDVIQKKLLSLGADTGAHSAYTLEGVAACASPLQRQELLALGESLKKALLRLQDLNYINADLLKHSLTFANFSLSILTGDTGQVIYGQPGKKESTTYQQGRLDARV